ncbi:PEP-CTERM sorting domain-containing protein [Massilia sp. B-10]|nr:PEP-CTERM sorting domain-containing protein [Massilia sp. B-10]UUZ54493.1 PEP-CTERM sorting domain-containing protein [Massilia sp. H-1]
MAISKRSSSRLAVTGPASSSNDGLVGVVPEPASIALLLTGVGLIGASRRRKAAPQA